MYDIIGDIHGHAEELKKLLQKLGYHTEKGLWQHKSRKCIFVGDYIDRGPAIRETLQIIKGMVDNGNAIALMGNHEFNALAYHYKPNHGDYLRRHNTKNTIQHAQTLAQFYFHREEWNEYLKWFYSLPLFLEIDGIRIVHACWDQDHMNWLQNSYPVKEADIIQPLLKSRQDVSFSLLTQELLVRAHDRSLKEYEVIEDVLKGKEIDIPSEYAWKDKDGIPRTKNRIKWWKEPYSSTHGEFLFHCPIPLQDIPFNQEIELNIYPGEDPPVFFGHYWLEHPTPDIMGTNVICLDYSVAKDGKLVAYQWNKGEEIDTSHFIY
jgi:hypothetical protein